MPTAMSTYTVGLSGVLFKQQRFSGKAKAVQILLERGASPDHAGGSHGTALQIAQNRLEDLKRMTHVRLYGQLFGETGPSGNLTSLTCYGRETVKPLKRFGDDYVPHLNFSYTPNADFQAVIDAIQSRSTL